MDDFSLEYSKYNYMYYIVFIYSEILGNCETGSQSWVQRDGNPAWPDMQDFHVKNRILVHENKTDRNICLVWFNLITLMFHAG